MRRQRMVGRMGRTSRSSVLIEEGLTRANDDVLVFFCSVACVGKGDYGL